MKNKFSFVFVYWWVLILFVFGSALMLFAEKDERESKTENRILSGFPELSAQTLFSGDFFTGIESYLSDGVFGRDSVVGISDNILGMFSAATHQDELLFDEMEMSDQIAGGGAETSDEDKETEATDDPSQSIQQDTAPDNTDNDQEEEFAVSDQIEGYGFWLEKTNGEYVRLVSVPEDKIPIVANTLNRFKSYLPEDGNVFYTNVPRTNMALMLRDSGKYSGWYENTDQAMEEYLDDGVYYVNAPAMLEEGLLAGEDLYFTSDHHWNPRGALRVVNECLRLQGTPSLPYDEYEYKINRFIDKTRNTNDELALLYPLQQVDSYDMANAERWQKAEMLIYEKSTYYAYLDGDTRGWQQFETGFTTGKNALVIGDSYSNCFLPYLMPYYDEVNKVDIRHYAISRMKYTLSELIEAEEITDVYIVVTHLNGVSGDKSYERLGRILG